MTKKIIVEIADPSIQTFSNNKFGELQVIEQNGEFQFIGRDVVNYCATIILAGDDNYPVRLKV